MSSNAHGAAQLPLLPHTLACAWCRTTVSAALCPRRRVGPHTYLCRPMSLRAHGAAQLSLLPCVLTQAWRRTTVSVATHIYPSAHNVPMTSATILMSGYHDAKMATHFSCSLADNLFSRIVHGGDWLSVYLFLVPTLPLPYLSSHAYFYKVNPNKRCPAALHFSIECISGLLALANPAITCPPPPPPPRANAIQFRRPRTIHPSNVCSC